MVPYQTRVEGDNVYVTLGQAPGGAPQPSFTALPAPSAGAAGGAAAASAQAGPRAIRNIDFRRGTDGAGRVIVELVRLRARPSTCGRKAADRRRLRSTAIPNELMRGYDVTDFATPVSGRRVRAGRRRALW